MKSYIPLETAAIFFSNELFFLKQGNRAEYVMVDFICMGLLDLFGTRTENYNENFLPTVEFEPGTFRLRGEHT